MLSSEREFRQIGIMGVGIVGGAVRNYFELEGVRPLLYDPGKELGSLTEINRADLVFVCVPTPYASNRGFDASYLDHAIASLGGKKTVVIKSTVLPGTTDYYQERFPQHRLLFNPEFLREASANDDFLKPDRQLVGYCNERDATIAQAILELLPPAPHERVVTARIAEMTKYATNSFLALKVIFANELHDLCEALDIDYATVKQSFAVDWRIGDSHLDVMDSGYRGYAGKCLPKDTMSLLDLADDIGVPMRVLEAAHQVNMELRAPVPMQRRETTVETVTADNDDLRERVA